MLFDTKQPQINEGSPLPSAFSFRCWCWSSRLTLERGPRPSSSSFCSPPLSFCSSSVKPFPLKRIIFCNWESKRISQRITVSTSDLKTCLPFLNPNAWWNWGEIEQFRTYHLLFSKFNRNVWHVVVIFWGLWRRLLLCVVSLEMRASRQLNIPERDGVIKNSPLIAWSAQMVHKLDSYILIHLSLVFPWFL